MHAEQDRLIEHYRGGNSQAIHAASLSLAALERIDQACQAFEKAWKAGSRASTEAYLADATEPERSALLRELLRLEVDYRRKTGETPTWEELQSRFPQDGRVIQEIFPENRLRTRDRQAPAPAADLPVTIDQRVTEATGATIGPYKLLQPIGEGGMGVVYMAEQSQPVSRRVALKIVKPGMDSREILARFEAERQALALMDHPNIARVLDAGATAEGRPYFVMELVKGIPITDFCDDRHLSLEERLELFVPVCEAVQHAHQKGIIHRDLKPSNVLVAQYDNRAVPKIIDFGLAKAFGQKLTEKTMYTQYGQIVGTIDYMSPEQACFNQLDVDTRSDIYSLGVLLYELLSGETPFDKKRLRSAAFDELLRILRNEEPPRPSFRLSSHASLAKVAANRRCEAKKLSLLVRGELDWIVMKAIDKERDRRYQSAGGFADDIRRFLDHEAVLACPPSAAYRFRKFARRNRALLASAAAVVAVLVLGLAGTSLALIRAIRAEERVTSELRQSNTAHLREMHQISLQKFRSDMSEKLDEIACRLLDRITRRISGDQRFSSPEVQSLQRDLLDETIRCWNQLIDGEKGRDGNPGRRQGFYRLQRALCLARSGDHVPAFKETLELREDRTRTAAWWKDLARICAHCATAAATQRDLARLYLNDGIEYLRQASDLAEDPPPAEDDVELAALRSHQEYPSILKCWIDNWQKKQIARKR